MVCLSRRQAGTRASSLKTKNPPSRRVRIIMQIFVPLDRNRQDSAVWPDVYRPQKAIQEFKNSF